MNTLIALNPLSGPACDLFSVLGSIATTQYLLRRYITLSSLLPPPPKDAQPIPVQEPEPTPQVVEQRRLFTRKSLRIFRSPVLAYIILWGLILRSKSPAQTTQDLTCGLMLFVPIATMTEKASYIICPDAEELSLHRKTPTSGMSVKSEDLGSRWSARIRTLCSIAVAGGTLYLASAAVHLPRPIVTGLLATQLSDIACPKMSVAIKITSVILLACLAVFLILISILDMSAPPTHSDINLSEWIVQLCLFPMTAFSVVPPSIILSMTYRYEYRRSHPSRPRDLKTSELQQPAPFPCPIYMAGVVSLIATLLLAPNPLEWWSADAFALYGGGSGPTGILLTTPVILAVVPLAVWIRGEMGAWWNYSETWVPEKDEVRSIWEDRMEQASGKKVAGLRGDKSDEPDEAEEGEVEGAM